MTLERLRSKMEPKTAANVMVRNVGIKEARKLAVHMLNETGGADRVWVNGVLDELDVVEQDQRAVAYHLQSI